MATKLIVLGMLITLLNSIEPGLVEIIAQMLFKGVWMESIDSGWKPIGVDACDGSTMLANLTKPLYLNDPYNFVIFNLQTPEGPRSSICIQVNKRRTNVNGWEVYVGICPYTKRQFYFNLRGYSLPPELLVL
jgi:hypothetical protein